nr:lysophospholipid acyltransferase family protein [Prevotella sp.]
MGKILYGSLYCIFYLVSLLPLTILYAISDGIYYMMYYVVRYRRHLVRKHLIDCFPEKSDEERLKIEREFYSWLCDYFMETIKLFTMSKKQVMKRMQFIGAEKVRESCQKGQSCAVYLGHYCNWEWVTSLQLWVGEDIACGQIYHPLENKAFDKLFLYLRNRLGAQCIPMAESIRKIMKMRQEGKPIVIGFIADQVPLWNNIHYWTDFLHHDTPVFTGTEKIARKMNLAVYYLDIQRLKRGYYQAEFKLLTEIPKEKKEFEITETYIRELEKTIQRQPAFWLWTHNRWKRTREQWLKIVAPVTHKMRTE